MCKLFKFNEPSELTSYKLWFLFISTFKWHGSGFELFFCCSWTHFRPRCFVNASCIVAAWEQNSGIIIYFYFFFPSKLNLSLRSFLQLQRPLYFFSFFFFLSPHFPQHNIPYQIVRKWWWTFFFFQDRKKNPQVSSSMWLCLFLKACSSWCWKLSRELWSWF